MNVSPYGFPVRYEPELPDNQNLSLSAMPPPTAQFISCDGIYVGIPAKDANPLINAPGAPPRYIREVFNSAGAPNPTIFTRSPLDIFASVAIL